MNKAVNIIVTCTSRKTHDPARGYRLRDLHERALLTRAQTWIEKLRASGGSQTKASELYCGEYWSVVRSLPMTARKSGIVLRSWICSAGYGLISPQSQLDPYSATFSPYERDCVTRGFDGDARREAARQWWQEIGQWRGPRGNELRSVQSIARRYPRTPLLVVASPDYLCALEKDLTNALDTLGDPDLLLIVSAGTKSLGRLTDHLLPCNATLQPVLGGTRGSLNIRIARLLLERAGKTLLNVERASVELGKLLRKQPPIVRYHRRAVTDQQVLTFIRLQLNRNGVVSRSVLLQRFRDSGKACEQSRFANLYRQMVIDEKVA
jgi:hypothetical protein